MFAFSHYLVIVVTMVSCAIAHRPPPVVCPSFWTAWHGSCYRYFGTPYLTWAEAEDFCRNLGWENPMAGGFETGAHLVSLHNYHEEKFVVDLWTTSRDATANNRIYTYGNDGPTLWIGLNDVAQEGTFKWTDGSTYSYSRWLPGEPNNSNNEDGVHIWLTARCGYLRFCWNDQRTRRNDWKSPFICKIPAYGTD